MPIIIETKNDAKELKLKANHNFAYAHLACYGDAKELKLKANHNSLTFGIA